MRRLLTAWHLSSSMMSFVSRSSSWVLVPCTAKVTLGDLWVISSGKTASSPKRSLTGVNFVALDSEVLCDHMIEVSSSTHFPLGMPCNLFEMPWRIMLFALLTRPLDCGCLTKAKQTFFPIYKQNSLNTSLLNWVPLSNVSSLGTPNPHMICCQKNFLMVCEVMVANGLASIHLVKYSMVTTA